MFLYLAYLWVNMPDSPTWEPKTALTAAFIGINGLLLKYFPKKWGENTPCPFDEKILQNNKDTILYTTFEELKNELFDKFNINFITKPLWTESP